MTPNIIFTPNIELSEFALQLRQYQQDNALSPNVVAQLLGVSLERLGLLQLDRVKPTSRECRRLKKLIAAVSP